MRNSKIGRKIFIYLLIITSIVGNVVFFFGYYQLHHLGSEFSRIEEEYSTMMATNNYEYLSDQQEDIMESLTAGYSQKCEMIFEHIQEEMMEYSSVLSSIYKNSSFKEFREVPLPSETKDWVPMGRGYLIDGVNETLEIKKEKTIMAMLEKIAAIIFERNAWSHMIQVCTEDGFYYEYSDDNTFEVGKDYRNSIWYKAAIENPDQLVWSEDSQRSFENLIVFCSRTFRNKDGKIAGVICESVELDQLVTSFSVGEIYDGAYVFLLNKDGQYIYHPDYQKDDFDRNPEHGKEDSFSSIIHDMQAGKNGIGQFKDQDLYYSVSYAPIKTCAWSLGIVISDNERYRSISDIQEKLHHLEMEAQDNLAKTKKRTAIYYNYIYVLLVLVVAFISYQISKHFREPIDHLADVAKQMGQGNLDVKAELHRNDELALLGDTLNKMSDDLKLYIKDMTLTLKEEEKNKTELNLAREIQASMLPSHFPAFPEKDSFDLYASMCPAKEVGGDFYDFFLIDDDHMALVCADVSGKGVPAAIYMAITKTLIKNQALQDSSPASILTKVNSILCEDNGGDMFVTVWFAIVDIHTGHMSYCNAGHENPFICRKDGKFEIFKDKHCFVLGGMDMVRYREYEMDLGPGDMIFIYTDGVAEAHNAQSELFGMERAVDVLNSREDAKGNPKKLIENLHVAIDEYAGETPQFDDITMLCYKQL